MISTTYDPGAKRFVSLGEMTLIDFVGFSPHRSPKRNGAKSAAARAHMGRRSGDAARALRGGDDPKWRRKPLKSLKTGAQMAPGVRGRRTGESIGRIPRWALRQPPGNSPSSKRLALNETALEAPRDRR
jgi:hypothetical protein